MNKNSSNKKDDLLNKSISLDFDQINPMQILISQNYFKNQNFYKTKESEFNSALSFQEKSIRTFISHCQHQNYHVSRENAIPLYYLARKYEIKSLIKETDEYFSNYTNDYLIQFLLKIQNVKFDDFENDITFFSNNLLDYINDDLFLFVPIPFVYRIFEQYIRSNSNSMISDHLIIELFFKFLDRYGRKASILFSLVSFKNDELFYLNRLISNYADVFDFNFINVNFLKELIQNEELKSIQEKKKAEILEREVKNKNNEIAGIKNIIFILFIAFSLLIMLLMFNFQSKTSNIRNELLKINQKYEYQLKFYEKVIQAKLINKRNNNTDYLKYFEI